MMESAEVGAPLLASPAWNVAHAKCASIRDAEAGDGRKL
jgi:hypothetical protein